MQIFIIWRRENRQQNGLAAILEGARYYAQKYGCAPNCLNLPAGFLTDEEISKLSTHWKVDTTAPTYFKNDIWIGVDDQIPAEAMA